MRPLKITRTNAILYCDRWDETVRFYRDMLKLQVLMEKSWFVEFQLTASARLSVAHAAHTSIRSARGAGLTLSWQVENLDGIRNRMIADGGEVGPIRESWGARALFLFDPEGNRIELWA